MSGRRTTGGSGSGSGGGKRRKRSGRGQGANVRSAMVIICATADGTWRMTWRLMKKRKLWVWQKERHGRTFTKPCSRTDRPCGSQTKRTSRGGGGTVSGNGRRKRGTTRNNKKRMKRVLIPSATAMSGPRIRREMKGRNRKGRHPWMTKGKPLTAKPSVRKSRARRCPRKKPRFLVNP